MNKISFEYIDALKAKIQHEVDTWTPIVGKELVRDCLKYGDTKYEWSPEGRAAQERYESELDYYSGRYLPKNIAETKKTLQRLRKRMSECEEYNPMFNHKVSSRMFANNAMTDHFRSVAYRLSIDPDLNLENSGEEEYARRVTFNIPITWHRSVYRRGLAVIKSGKGKHFVVSVTPVAVPWIEEQGMVAFKCKTIFFKRRHGEAVDGWLTLFQDGSNSGDNPVVDDDGKLKLPHAFHDDLRRSVSLLNSRTFRSLSNML